MSYSPGSKESPFGKGMPLSANAEALRAWADQRSTFCVFATLYEIREILTGQMAPQPEEAWAKYQALHGEEAKGAVSPQKFFEVLDKYAKEVGLIVLQVLANPSALTDF